MTESHPWSHRLRIADLPAGQTRDIDLAPAAEIRAALAADLGIPAVRKLRFTGRLVPLGRTDWRLEAKLGATVVQECVATLAPVTTRIDEPVIRSYLARLPDLPEGDEIEMPQDDTAEPLPEVLDLGEVMAEALALALPPWPRAPGAGPADSRATPEGAAPLDDKAVRPFAGLASLRDKLEGKE